MRAPTRKKKILYAQNVIIKEEKYQGSAPPAFLDGRVLSSTVHHDLYIVAHAVYLVTFVHMLPLFVPQVELEPCSDNLHQGNVALDSFTIGKSAFTNNGLDIIRHVRMMFLEIANQNLDEKKELLALG